MMLLTRPYDISGWGDDIIWVQTYEEGLFHAQKSNKPLMVIHHLEDCQYCQDPSLTVRADITGRYSNRLYTYEPQDLPLCKYSRSALDSGNS
ncbi:Anterior gradient protein 3 [Sciurus carolinensis]|uniref:Anterior gradient protein 3 n=1 Tax=Sciurus carolinensis TaxID=30640 RepID=A0AA41SYW9_SCICA|nr:Anterior gradient protein 3 [Sciurus carolinensis]